VFEPARDQIPAYFQSLPADIADKHFRSLIRKSVVQLAAEHHTKVVRLDFQGKFRRFLRSAPAILVRRVNDLPANPISPHS